MSSPISPTLVSPLERPSPRENGRTLRGQHTQRELPPLPINDPDEVEPASLNKHPSVSGWPDQPRTLHRGGWLSFLSCVGDSIVILASIIFFVFGAFVIHFDGVPVSKVSQIGIIMDASRYGPTIFPILFAAIVGQAMHAIAHWRIENGERMKVLDQLLGSTGLFSAIVTQLKFRNIGLVGMALIFLWILSPVGGQASLRVLEFGKKTESQNRTLYAIDWRSRMFPSVWTPSGTDMTESRSMAETVFGSSLARPLSAKLSSTDLWGNTRIPMLERLPNFYQSVDKDGWYDIKGASVTYAVYAALVGVPMTEVSPTRNTSFTMDASYWTLDCPVLERGDYSIPGDDGDDDWVKNKSIQWQLSSKVQPTSKPTDKNLTSRAIYYASMDGPLDGSTRATCYVNTSYVEVEVSCHLQDCATNRIRYSRKPHPPQAYMLGAENNIYTFLSSLFGTVGGNMHQPTAIQRYFRHPASPFNFTDEDLALYALPKVEFEMSLAQIFNTWWLAMIGASELTSRVSGQVPLNQTTPQFNESKYTTWYQPINATEWEDIPVVTCSRPWLAALFIATGAMFLSGVFGLVLEITRKAPDFSLNISSLMRDNPYIELPPGGSTLDSLERSRLLRKVRVRLGDVRPGEEVGYVTIASCDREGGVEKLRGLEKSRTFS